MGDGQLTQDEETIRVKYPALKRDFEEKNREITLYKTFLAHKHLLSEFEKWYETEITEAFLKTHPPKSVYDSI